MASITFCWLKNSTMHAIRHFMARLKVLNRIYLSLVTQKGFLWLSAKTCLFTILLSLSLHFLKLILLQMNAFHQCWEKIHISTLNRRWELLRNAICANCYCSCNSKYSKCNFQSIKKESDYWKKQPHLLPEFGAEKLTKSLGCWEWLLL